MTYHPANRRWQQKRYRANLQRINEIKMAVGCTDCGYNENPVALEFDHLPRHKKSWSIGGNMLRNLDSLLAEIAKCEVVCANCHAIRGQVRRSVTGL